MSHRVELAMESDVEAWLALAAEVGDLFGADMARDPKFRGGVERSVLERAALCVRIDGTLAGGMLFTSGTIKWLAVLRAHRRCGAGRALVAHAQSCGRDVGVTTFGAEHPHPDSQAARELYRAMGFVADPVGVGPGPDGTPREAMLWRVVP